MTIRMDQPKRFDLVGDRVMIAGIGTGFEATINYRVHEGHDEVTGSINVGGGTGEHAQFQVKANVSNAAFQLDRLFVEVFEVSAQDGSEIHKVSKPVLLGTRMVDGDYIGYREHVVEAKPHRRSRKSTTVRPTFSPWCARTCTRSTTRT